MQLFKFDLGIYYEAPIVLEGGELIEGLDSVTWIERYSEPGEFEIQAKLSSGIREKLPIGSVISHVETTEVMMVENHELKQDEDQEVMVVVTGRSFWAFLEFRQEGWDWSGIPEIQPIVTASIPLPWIIVNDINAAISNLSSDFNNIVRGVNATTELVYPNVDPMVLKRDTVLNNVLDLLSVGDLGLKTVRRSPTYDPDDIWTDLIVHEGEDRTRDVVFSWKSGDLSGANYLFSNKKNATAAFVVGRWIWTRVAYADNAGYFRRTIYVNGSDIDDAFDAAPTGADLTTVQNRMIIRGQQAINSTKNIVITQADISNIANYQYRRDYNIGDFVTLDANFGQMAIMRVIEHTEIEDLNGETKHPTLSLPYLETSTARSTLGGFLETS